MQQAVIQTFLINIIVNHINEAITLAIAFQLLISFFKMIFKISIRALYNARTSNIYLTTVIHFLNGFRYFTDLLRGICAIGLIVSSSMYCDRIEFFPNS